MKKSEKESRDFDLIREWTKNTPDVFPPEGFTYNVMTRIALEPSRVKGAFRNPLGKSFWLVVSVVFVFLLILSLQAPSLDITPIREILPDLPDISRFKQLFSLQGINEIPGYRYIVYITSGILLLVLFDTFIQRFIPGRK